MWFKAKYEISIAEPKETTEVEDNWENEDKLDRKKSAYFLTN